MTEKPSSSVSPALAANEISALGSSHVEHSGTDIRGTDIRGTDIRGTDIRGTDIRGTDSRGADSRSADSRASATLSDTANGNGEFKRSFGKPGPFQIVETSSAKDVSSFPACPRAALAIRANFAHVRAPWHKLFRPSVFSGLDRPAREHGNVDFPQEPPRRRYSCTFYATCLDLAAALNWDNFTCRGCCGQIDEKLLWRARQAMRRDEVARTVCELPSIQMHATEVHSGQADEEPTTPPLRQT